MCSCCFWTSTTWKRLQYVSAIQSDTFTHLHWRWKFISGEACVNPWSLQCVYNLKPQGNTIYWGIICFPLLCKSEKWAPIKKNKKQSWSNFLSQPDLQKCFNRQTILGHITCTQNHNQLQLLPCFSQFFHSWVHFAMLCMWSHNSACTKWGKQH